MAKGDLRAKAPDSINWHNTGIPTDSSNIDLVEGLLESGAEYGTDVDTNLGPTSETNLGLGPQGNLFGTSAPDAQDAIDSSLKYNFNDSVVMERPELQAVEAVEGFGEPTPSQMATPLVTNRGS